VLATPRVPLLIQSIGERIAVLRVGPDHTVPCRNAAMHVNPLPTNGSTSSPPAGAIVTSRSMGASGFTACLRRRARRHLDDVLLAQSAVDRFTNSAFDFVIEGESYRPRIKPKLDPDAGPPPAPAQKPKIHPRSRHR
jgi:hypothetical protein